MSKPQAIFLRTVASLVTCQFGAMIWSHLELSLTYSSYAEMSHLRSVSSVPTALAILFGPKDTALTTTTKIFHLFIYFRKTRDWEHGGVGQRGRRGRERIKHRAWHRQAWFHDPETVTPAKTKSWTFNQLSHPGNPPKDTFDSFSNIGQVAACGRSKRKAGSVTFAGNSGLGNVNYPSEWCLLSVGAELLVLRAKVDAMVAKPP